MMLELLNWTQDWRNPIVMMDAAILLGALITAWLVTKFLGKDAPKDSILFGERQFDGLLFPLIALGIVFIAHHGLKGYQEAIFLRTAIYVLSLMSGFRLIARVLLVAYPSSMWVRLVERLVAWTGWIIGLLWITGLLPRVLNELQSIELNFGKSKLDMRTLFEGVLSIVVMIVITLWLSYLIERKVLNKAVDDLSLRKVSSSIIRIALLVLGTLFSLSAVGVDLTVLSVMGGMLGVGLGFGLQNISANYVSGFLILFERSLKIGDHVKIDECEGIVKDIRTRFTVIEDITGSETVVPNEMIITTQITNLSRSQSRTRIAIDVLADPDESIEGLKEILHKATVSCDALLPKPSPRVYLIGLEEEGLRFQVEAWTLNNPQELSSVRSQLNIKLVNALISSGKNLRKIRLVQPTVLVSLSTTGNQRAT
jgi:small-conductance mechanosensitive channel